jgi:hypothetical protein
VVGHHCVRNCDFQEYNVSPGCEADEKYRSGTAHTACLMRPSQKHAHLLPQMAKLKPEMEALQASVKHTGSMYSPVP